MGKKVKGFVIRKKSDFGDIFIILVLLFAFVSFSISVGYGVGFWVGLLINLLFVVGIALFFAFVTKDETEERVEMVFYVDKPKMKGGLK